MGCQCAKSTAVSAAQPGGPARTSAPSKGIIEKKVQQAQQTRVLALRECALKALPAAVTAAEGAPFRSVDLSVNSLASLHQVVGSWTNLQTLLCGQNALTELPPAIGQLESLNKLILSQNKLRTLPIEMRSLGKLKILQLDGNLLGPSLPDIFGEALATTLEELDLSGNALQSLPASLGSVKTLTRLRVDKNELEELPEEFGGLIKLNYLDAAGNKLRGVPPPLLSQTDLAELWLKGNPIDRLELQKTPGFDAFMQRRKQRLDQKIDQAVVGEVNLAVCGLD
eukprot:TRINITY_DN35392_c0_g1_i1.p1 TRINITY_DN35392_c0_g1~~TRINITY_DN35392_c0_g1_i1.p1  ORF type:complete len:282 (-),score=79.88 TRINITY_DN35392_c0_g1_i1:226-1071(-)